MLLDSERVFVQSRIEALSTGHTVTAHACIGACSNKTSIFTKSSILTVSSAVEVWLKPDSNCQVQYAIDSLPRAQNTRWTWGFCEISF